MLPQLLKMSEFRDAYTGLDFHSTGKLITPFGANLIKTSFVTNPDMMIGLDKNCALEMVKVGDIETDYGKLVDRQLEQIAITSIAGFARILPGCVKTLSAQSFNSGGETGEEFEGE